MVVVGWADARMDGWMDGDDDDDDDVGGYIVIMTNQLLRSNVHRLMSHN
jgi:hypothetical protein